MTNFQIKKICFFSLLAFSLQFSQAIFADSANGKKWAKEKKKERGKRGHRGFLGQQGAPGTPGEPGTPGGPGTAQVIPYISVVADESPIPNTSEFYNTQTVPVGSPILFNPATTITNVSSDITLSPDGSTFTISSNGFYEIIFGCFYFGSTVNPASVSLLQNNTATFFITTFATPVGTSGGAWAQAAVIINQTASPATYQIVNDPSYSTTSITLQGVNPNGSDGAYVTIKKIAP